MESRTQGQGQGQGHKKYPRPRPRTALPKTDTLEAKDRNAQGQGQGLRTQAQVLSKKKRSSQKFFRPSPQKNVFQKISQTLHKILTIQKIVLSSSRGQANFRGLEASRPRPRTSKCVLEVKDVLKDSTSVYYTYKVSVISFNVTNSSNQLNLSLYSLCYAEACSKFARPISALLRSGNTDPSKELLQRRRAIGNTVPDLTGLRFELQTSRLREESVIAS